MIDFRRATIFLPIYVVAMLAVDAAFNSPGWGRPDRLPIWLLVVFTAAAVAVFAIAGRYLFRRHHDEVAASTDRAVLAILAGVVISGLANDLLAGIVRLTLNTRSIWVMVPVYVLTYLLFFAIIRWVLNRGKHAGH